MDIDHISNFVGGWIIGDFAPALLRTKDFEVALKVHHRDEKIERHRHNIVTEYNLLTAGEMLVNGQVLKAGATFIFKPGEFVEATVLSDVVHVVCVKVPSVPSDKEVVEK